MQTARIESIEADFDEFRGNSKAESQKKFMALENISQLHTDHGASIKQIHIEKVNFSDLDNLRVDLKTALDSTIEEIDSSLKGAIVDITEATKRRSETSNDQSDELKESLAQFKTDQTQKIDRLEADFILFRQRANESIQETNTQLCGLHENTILNLELQQRNVKKLESAKVNYEDLEGLRKDIKATIREAIEVVNTAPWGSKPEDEVNVKEIPQKDAINDIASYLYQDSFTESPKHSVTVPYHALAQTIQAVQTQSHQAPMQQRPPRLTTRYALKPSRDLDDINKKLAQFKHDLHERRVLLTNVRSKAKANAARLPEYTPAAPRY